MVILSYRDGSPSARRRSDQSIMGPGSFLSKINVFHLPSRVVRRAWLQTAPDLPHAAPQPPAQQRSQSHALKPTIGYNYDTFAAGLDAVLSTLNVTDVSLVGFSMGTGEVTRYIGKYGTKRVRKAVLIGTLGPYLRMPYAPTASKPSPTGSDVPAALTPSALWARGFPCGMDRTDRA
jgi:pimeloyl-ACP methyl ester carboxylesterase